jgi:hypothetical protein
MRDIDLLGEVKRKLDFGASVLYPISPKQVMSSQKEVK